MGPMPHRMPVIAQISFCASLRSLRLHRLIHISTAAIGWRKIESRISTSTFTLVPTVARLRKLRERAALDVKRGAREKLASARIVADEERRHVHLPQHRRKFAAHELARCNVERS